MALRNILTGDEPRLRKKSRVVTDFDKRLHVLIDDMRETLVNANGLGLAAPQIGVLRKVALVVDINTDTEPATETVIELINPEIIERIGTQDGTEGCLSLPGVYGFVCRPETVIIRAHDRFGKEFELTCNGLTARAVCHEVDHLDGIIFTTLTDHTLTEEQLDKLLAENAAMKEVG